MSSKYITTIRHKSWDIPALMSYSNIVLDFVNVPSRPTMTVRLNPIPIQPNFQFTLPVKTYENGDPIEQVYVNWSCGLTAWVRPKKKDGILQAIQHVMLSPYIVTEITGRGRVINISPEGKSISFEDHIRRNGIAVFCDFN